MKSANPDQQRGLSLMEVLVALTVLSIGLLGVTAMQANGLRTHHAAHLHTQASLIAHDMLNRIRANPLGRTYYPNADTQNEHLTSPNCIHSGCTPEQLAQHDLYQWQQQLGQSPSPPLPAGRGLITRDAKFIHVIVLWRESMFERLKKRSCIPNQPTDMACISLSAHL